MTGFPRPLRRRAGLALALGTVLLAAGPVEEVKAQSAVGKLSCRVESGFGYLFWSNREMLCHFENAGGRGIQTYVGQINNYGLDIGFVRSGVILWTVIASAAPSDGALEGKYVGASAQIAVAYGAGANALLGTNNIVLNPLSVTGLRGLNLAAGVSSLHLRPIDDYQYDAPMPLPPPR